MKRLIQSYLISLIIVFIYAFIKLPVLTFDFLSLYSLLIMLFVIAGVLDMMLDRKEKISNGAKYSFLIALVLVVISTVAPFLTTSSLLHAKEYRNLLGEVIESDFTEDVSPVSVNDIRLVDEAMAMKLGDKKLGEVPALGSVSKLGDFHIQAVDGELFWVAPLVHKDFIKWITNLDGSSGYVMVSASNPQDVRLIQEIDSKPIKIVYQPQAYFLQDLQRHIYINGIVDVGMTDFTLEIDDNGIPYWITTLYTHKIGFGGADAVGVCTVNAQSGEVKRYSIEDAPSWIDRIQPENFVIEQINNWGLYVKGFLNSVISEEGVLVATEGTSLVYGQDSKSYWYTGITSSGSDESTIGFMLVDTRTKEAKLYKQPGATETAAMTSAEGKVQEKNYNATFPVMYNILNTPTYVSSLKDKAGLVKSVAFISVEDFSLLAIGETKEEAFRNYKDVLASNGNNITIDNSSQKEELEDIVLRISADVKNANTYYYIILDSKDIIFSATSSISNEIPLTTVGDRVKISYEKTQSDFVDIIEFKNLTLNINN